MLEVVKYIVPVYISDHTPDCVSSFGEQRVAIVLRAGREAAQYNNRGQSFSYKDEEHTNSGMKNNNPGLKL
jgi:hypothetical protein